MQRKMILLGLMAILVAALGCDTSTMSSPEFNLPQGNAENGQEVFVSMGCTSCHTIRGLDLPASQVEGPVMIVLGGPVSKVKSYGELVSSIINPSHRLARGFKVDEVSQEGQSLMTIYNDVVTVTELIDLVEFLQSEYDVVPRPGYRYTIYSYE